MESVCLTCGIGAVTAPSLTRVCVGILLPVLWVECSEERDETGHLFWGILPPTTCPTLISHPLVLQLRVSELRGVALHSFVGAFLSLTHFPTVSTSCPFWSPPAALSFRQSLLLTRLE